MKARERGAKLIHVDPRFSRTSAMADMHIPIRAGSDIAFLGGLIRHVLDTGSYFKEYVLHYTNAATLLNEDFKGPEDLDGFFSGWDPESKTYDPDSWSYEGGSIASPAGQREHATQAFSEHQGGGMMEGEPERDETLEHPRTVFRQLMRHYARYTPEMVEAVCGISQADFLKAANTLIENSGREKTTAFCYALGWTQHTSGVQMIRAAAILQLLLGNMGRPGGGIMAMRGHASIQGSTRHPHALRPAARLPADAQGARGRATRSSDYVDVQRHRARLVGELRQVHRLAPEGLLRRRRDRGERLRLRPAAEDHAATTRTSRRCCARYDGGLDGLFVMGQNPAVGSQHSGLQRRALAHLKWLVVRDLAELETATFWRDAPEVRSGEMRPEDIQTEVFLMPAAAHVEKDGHFTNTQRLLQWHDKAIEPPGDARSELWFMHHLSKRVRAHYEGSTADRDWPIVNLNWDYPEVGEIRDPDAEAVLKEINGYDVASGAPVSRVRRAEGRRHDGVRLLDLLRLLRRRRQPDAAARPRRPRLPRRLGLARVGWAWPANRRVLYNRASADPEGKPVVGAQEVRLVGRAAGQVDGLRRAGLPGRQGARLPRPNDAKGMDAISRRRPVHHDGRRQGWLYSPSGPARRPDADALRAARVAGREPALPRGGLQPGGADLGPAGQPAPRRGRPALPVRGDDVPAHRAPHRRAR